MCTCLIVTLALGGSFLDLWFNHENNENWHHIKISRNTVWPIVLGSDDELAVTSAQDNQDMLVQAV